MALVLGMHDNGRTLTAAPGTAIVVTLPSNPSTGYEWKLIASDGRVVRLVSQRYLPPAKQIPGAGGRETLRFVAKARGVVTLVLGYLRPWQPKHVVQRFRVTLHVT
ncbi:MAG TPA: protease inhibitor I42 family protein [Gaiellaceae bacterium]|nr:protease inhibitor I42 family protein [Gaiellaceae bacterium]